MRIENSFIPVEGSARDDGASDLARGRHHVESFDPAVDVAGVGSTTADRIEPFIAEALTHLDDGDSAYFDRTFPSGERWRLYENFREETCFFDIETTGLDEHRDRVTTVSFHRDGRRPRSSPARILPRSGSASSSPTPACSRRSTAPGSMFLPRDRLRHRDRHAPPRSSCTPASGSDSLEG